MVPIGKRDHVLQRQRQIRNARRMRPRRRHDAFCPVPFRAACAPVHVRGMVPHLWVQRVRNPFHVKPGTAHNAPFPFRRMGDADRAEIVACIVSHMSAHALATIIAEWLTADELAQIAENGRGDLPIRYVGPVHENVPQFGKRNVKWSDYS